MMEKVALAGLITFLFYFALVKVFSKKIDE